MYRPHRKYSLIPTTSQAAWSNLPRLIFEACWESWKLRGKSNQEGVAPTDRGCLQSNRFFFNKHIFQKFDCLQSNRFFFDKHIFQKVDCLQSNRILLDKCYIFLRVFVFSPTGFFLSQAYFHRIDCLQSNRFFKNKTKHQSDDFTGQNNQRRKYQKVWSSLI